MLETVRPSRVKLEFVDDLRRRTFELGGDIDVIVAVTPKQDAVHVVEGSVTLVRELEIVRVSTVMVSAGRTTRNPVMVPKVVQEKSVDILRHATAVFSREEVIAPGRATFTARLAVPEDLPRPPDNVTSSVANWKLVATLELIDGSTFRAEQVVSERG